MHADVRLVGDRLLKINADLIEGIAMARDETGDRVGQCAVEVKECEGSHRGKPTRPLLVAAPASLRS